MAQIFDDPSGLPKIQLFSGSSFKAEYSVTLLDKNSEENQKLEKQIEERIKQEEERIKLKKEKMKKEEEERTRRIKERLKEKLQGLKEDE